MFHVITLNNTVCKCALGAIPLNRWVKNHRDYGILCQLYKTESSFIGRRKASVGVLKLSYSHNRSELETVTDHLRTYCCRQ